MVEPTSRRRPAGASSLFKDRLFLGEPNFTDPAYPGQVFYCWHCALLEGVLALCPDLKARIEVVRVAWPRPRAALIAAVSPRHQSVPLLLLAPESAGGARRYRVHDRVIEGPVEILKALSRRHGIPAPHP